MGVCYEEDKNKYNSSGIIKGRKSNITSSTNNNEINNNKKEIEISFDINSLTRKIDKEFKEKLLKKKRENDLENNNNNSNNDEEENEESENNEDNNK